MAITDLDTTDNDDALYYNLSIHTADLGMTNLCKRGLCAIEDGDLLRVMLHLFGMDVTRSWYFEPLLDGCGYVSQYTGQPIIGGDLIVGYERQDDNWIWTGSLAAFARFYNQRTDPHAQKEIQDLATDVGKLIKPLFPVAWKHLTGDDK